MAGQVLVGLLASISSPSTVSHDYPSLEASRKDVVVRLKWIGSVREGEKIDTRNMVVQPMGIATSMTRTLRGLNRTQTRVFLTTTIEQAVKIVGDDINHIAHSSDIPAIERLLLDLDNAVKAIPFIQQTYNEDRTFNCALDDLRESTTQHLLNFRELMTFRASTSTSSPPG